MELTLILGDYEIDKRSAVHRATSIGDRSLREVQVIDAESHREFRLGEHSNPDYRVRYRRERDRWKRILRDMRSGDAGHVALLCSAFLADRAGLELSLPIDVFRLMADHIHKTGGKVEIVVLIDDSFNARRTSAEAIAAAVSRRHLEWTFAQYLATQFRASRSPGVRCFAVDHPIHNLANVLARRAVLASYLCHPINVFRRNSDHPDRPALEAFRARVAGIGITVYDPLGIDEQALISTSTGVHTNAGIVIRPRDRWQPTTVKTILAHEPELEANSQGVKVRPRPSPQLGSQAKAQVPQRDFFWIDSADVVVAWRPFLGNTHHAGVLSEIQYAIHHGKRVLAYSPREDGDEHPSPFASMVTTFRELPELFDRLRELTKLNAREEVDVNLGEKPPKYCDHTSVGVLIHNDRNELLLIERGTFPFGIAAPAGHVDGHLSYDEAAIAEVREEVGLEVTDLKLVAEGRRENPCRRVNGTWHYWKIFEAKAMGDLKLSPREAKRAEWCSPQRLVKLGLVAGERLATSAGLERVWLDWLTELQILHLDPAEFRERGSVTE